MVHSFQIKILKIKASTKRLMSIVYISQFYTLPTTSQVHMATAYRRFNTLYLHAVYILREKRTIYNVPYLYMHMICLFFNMTRYSFIYIARS